LRKHHPTRNLEGYYFLFGYLKEDLFHFYYLYCLDQGLAKFFKVGQIEDILGFNKYLQSLSQPLSSAVVV